MQLLKKLNKTPVKMISQYPQDNQDRDGHNASL